MRLGTIVKNPYVNKYYSENFNPLYLTMVIHVGSEYTTCLRYDGKLSKYFTRDIRQWEIIDNIAFANMILDYYRKEN